MEKCNFKYCNNMAFLSSSLQIREAAGIADKMKPHSNVEPSINGIRTDLEKEVGPGEYLIREVA